MGTDAYTQEELEAAVQALALSFQTLLVHVRRQGWLSYRERMRIIDLQYRQLRSRGPGLGVAATRR